jgi:lysophospholipase L1-like esterase
VKLRALVPAALLLGLVPSLVSAQTNYLAFGDSITAGVGDDPARAQPGWPPRLQALLQSVGASATVGNYGKGGEKTPEALLRIDSVLALGKPGDTLILMEGTNNINQSISLETTIGDLDNMAFRAEGLGIKVIHATVIPRPPTAKVDADNTLTDQLNGRIRTLAGPRGRKLADPNEVFRNTPNLFSGFYSADPTDRVGHPNAAGYDILARVFYNVIRNIDAVSPVPGNTLPVTGSANIKPDTNIQVNVWDFGTGIDLANTFLLVNGQVTPAVPQGNALHATFDYQPPAPLAGKVTLGLRSKDLATPPNAIDRQIASFTIRGSALQGDLNGDNRVDGMDLVLLALHFGAVQGDPAYDATADLNADGRVDGLDLAILAAGFGQSRS